VLKAKKLPAGYSQIGDDVAVIPSRGERVVLKVDMVVESIDVPTGMTYRQAARKAVAMCVSDFGAKGVRPDSFMVSLGLRRGVPQEEVDALGKGFRDAEESWGVHMVGGDTNEASELVIDCAMVGFGGKVVGRSGAEPGDLLVVSGPFGLPPAGLKILMNGAKASPLFRKRAISSVLMPTPNLEAGISVAKYLTSGMDSSDGLARSLHTLASASGVGFELEALTGADGVWDFATKNGLSYQELVTEGGEEYVVVGTLARKKFSAARKAVARAGGRLAAIGRATGKSGVVLIDLKGRMVPIRDVGWIHLG